LSLVLLYFFQENGKPHLVTHNAVGMGNDHAAGNMVATTGAYQVERWPTFISESISDFVHDQADRQSVISAVCATGNLLLL
jgi:hypothetical protein